MSTSGQRKLISWCPNVSSWFAVGGVDLRLFEYDSLAGKTGSQDEASPVRLVSLVSFLRGIQTMDWCPDPNWADMIVVGTETGQLSLCRLSSSEMVVRSFVPSLRGANARACNDVSWNGVSANLVAAAYSKQRDYASVMVWDIDQPKSIDDFDSQEDSSFHAFSTTSGRSVATVSRPMIEFPSRGESAVACSWQPGSEKILLVGFRERILRLYDCRAGNSDWLYVKAHEKGAVRGLCFDPFSSNRFCTYSDDGLIKLWDLRQLSSPSFMLKTREKRLVQVSWCPTSPNTLTSVSRNDSVVKQWTVFQSESVRPAEPREKPTDVAMVLENILTGGATLSDMAKVTDESMVGPPIPPPLPQSIPTLVEAKQITFRDQPISEPSCSFSWHPSIPGLLLSVGWLGTVEKIQVHERVPISWSPNGLISRAIGSDVFSSSSGVIFESNSRVSADQKAKLEKILIESGTDNLDVSYVMSYRAALGYGTDMTRNIEICDMLKQSSLSWLWRHLLAMKELGGRKQSKKQLHLNMGSSILSILSPRGSLPDQANKEALLPTYDSSRRREIEVLCGWEREDVGLEKKIAFSVIRGDIDSAIALLKTADSSDYSLIYLILSTIDKTKNEERVFYCKSLLEKKEGVCSNPYLRAIIVYLSLVRPKADITDRIVPPVPPILSRKGKLNTAKVESASAIQPVSYDWVSPLLEMKGISMLDRIGIANRLLSDGQLLSYLAGLQDDCVSSGSIEGLCLTGVGNVKGNLLLESYVDNCSDVQSALLVLSVVKHEMNLDDDTLVLFDRYYTSYKQLLNAWKMWHVRAKLDVFVGNKNEERPPQVMATCNFCNKSFASPMDKHSQVSSMGPGARQRNLNCPHCSRQLPRCAVCLLPMETLNQLPGVAKRFAALRLGRTKEEGSLEDMKKWFVLCQDCHHGGHENCWYQWFTAGRHQCPVSGCDCMCMR